MPGEPEILQTSELARDLWENQPQVWMHEDGDRRSLRLPGADDPTNVEILSWTPLRNPAFGPSFWCR